MKRVLSHLLVNLTNDNYNVPLTQKKLYSIKCCLALLAVR